MCLEETRRVQGLHLWGVQVKRKERDRQREWYKVEEQGSHKASTEFKRSGDRDRNRERETKSALELLIQY